MLYLANLLLNGIQIAKEQKKCHETVLEMMGTMFDMLPMMRGLKEEELAGSSEIAEVLKDCLDMVEEACSLARRYLASKGKIIQLLVKGFRN